MHNAYDYPTLRVIWWGLLGVLLIGFALTDGWDLGVGRCCPSSAAPTPSGGWRSMPSARPGRGTRSGFILGGGAIFAAWPFVYAVSFSGFYLAMFAGLASLILRPVGFKYRSKRSGPVWRSCWDWLLFVGGFVPSLVFGVAVGNVLQGCRSASTAICGPRTKAASSACSPPFTLLCGLLSVAMIVLHGAAFLTIKIEAGDGA